MHVSDAALQAQLRDSLVDRPEVVFAVLFGSAVAGRRTTESDVDVAVYFRDAAAGSNSRTDVEEPGRRFPAEEEVWAGLEHTAGIQVDMVVLNRAPATVAAAALLTGELLLVRDPALYARYFLAVTTLAEEERDFTDDYLLVKQRSRSLSPVDRGRLVRIVDFLEDELADEHGFVEIDLERYSVDRTFRRAVERWVENLVNASIDAAKIVLASERRPVPQTYREALEMLATVDGFREHGELTRRLAANTRVRNMLAHEYLDLRYTQVHQVVTTAASDYGALLAALRVWLAATVPMSPKDQR